MSWKYSKHHKDYAEGHIFLGQPYVITDLGEDLELTIEETGEVHRIGRYGVWQDGKVIDTFFDLEKAKETYGNLPVHPVITISGEK